ncbi:MAG: Rpn family recombination-promoting nuclease/putative transposase [Eubacteriales bacterium]|nr:Rpn family recombination-promoting nuclease/putative transposase [Eubacteriales bacterium]
MAKMPTPDAALKKFFRDNEIFAALFNDCLFGHEEIIQAEELLPMDTAFTDTVPTSGRYEKISKYRDNLRQAKAGCRLVILGVEDQDMVHYAMPVRKLLYDALCYSSELTGKTVTTEEKKEWTADERLSGVRKGTMLTPVITVVFYTGGEPWDGPKSLHEMMDMDEQIVRLVPDYPLWVIDMGHDESLSFTNKTLEELRNILLSIYSGTAADNDMEFDNSVISLAGILTGDRHLYMNAGRARGGKQTMWRVIEERDKKLVAEAEAKQASKALNERNNSIRLLYKNGVAISVISDSFSIPSEEINSIIGK